MISNERVVVVGASLSGLLAAAAAAEAGCLVTVLERDPVLEGSAARRGVPQGAQNHVLLHRGLVAAEELVPGLERAIEDAGAVRLNTGEMPWYGPNGWQSTDVRSYDVLSLTRPLLERLVRERVLARPDVGLVAGVRVRALERTEDGWLVRGADGDSYAAAVVVDASGRGSRMPQWLTALGHRVPEPEVVDAAVGYATLAYREPEGRRLPPGLVVAATPGHPRMGLALPVEDGRWLVSATGYGAAHRPGREGFAEFLATLRDPAVASLADVLEPVGEPAVHRQTSNRRHRYGRGRDWPAGLLVVGDALCAFDPLYGQGITVGACQALVLRDALRRPGRPLSSSSRRTRAVQRRLADVAALPWSVATTEDSRYIPGRRRRLDQRLATAWTSELALVAQDGHRRTIETFGGVYHLMVPAWRLLHPALLLAVARRRLTRRSGSPPRPESLAGLVTFPARSPG